MGDMVSPYSWMVSPSEKLEYKDIKKLTYLQIISKFCAKSLVIE